MRSPISRVGNKAIMGGNKPRDVPGSEGKWGSGTGPGRGE